MKPTVSFRSLVLTASFLAMPLAGGAQEVDPHGWLGTETLETRFGDFQFEGGYPAGATADRLFEIQMLSRAIEVYQNQLMRVSEAALDEGLRAFGVTKPTQVVIWEDLMDSATVMLTANTETVYAITHFDLQPDAPMVIDVPPHMLGAMQDSLQRWLADVGPLGADKGEGGKFLVVPPGYEGSIPDGHLSVRSPTYGVTLFLRGFQQDGSTDAAVATMKQIKIYPLAEEASPPPMEFLDGSKQDIQVVFPDNFHFFELLAGLVEGEPSEVFEPLERAQMQAIGIEKGKPFAPDEKTKALLSEAARIGGAIARAVTFDSRNPGVFYYPGRKWQGAPEGIPYTFMLDGTPQIDARNNVYYMAAGNSPAMVEKNVGQGSQYLWTYRDADGAFLDGARTYKLHVPADIPVGAFWSVVVYDALSRSELQTDQALPSVSGYSDPAINADGTVDIFFGPERPEDAENWIQTVPGKGWFPIFRFYSPKEAYFDKTWELEDIVLVK